MEAHTNTNNNSNKPSRHSFTGISNTVSNGLQYKYITSSPNQFSYSANSTDSINELIVPAAVSISSR